MDKASLRPLVLDILRKTPQTHLHAIETEIRRQTEDYERHDALVLQEIVWDHLVHGVLAPGKNSLNLNLPFVHVTEFGTACLESGEALVHDPDVHGDGARFPERFAGVADQVGQDLFQLVRIEVYDVTIHVGGKITLNRFFQHERFE